MQKRKVGGGGSGRSGRLVRMVVNEELRLFWKCKKERKKSGRVRVGGSGWM